MRWRGLNHRHPDEGQDPDRKVGPGGRGSCQPQPPPSPWGEGAAKRRMRGDGEVFAITCKHRDFPLSRRMRATLSPGRGSADPAKLIPTLKTCGTLISTSGKRGMSSVPCARKCAEPVRARG